MHTARTHRQPSNRGVTAMRRRHPFVTFLQDTLVVLTSLAVMLSPILGPMLADALR